MLFSPVKELARENQLEAHQPTRLKIDETKALFASHNADVAVVVAYGRILPIEFECSSPGLYQRALFTLAKVSRCIASKRKAIVNGDHETGVTTMFIEPTLDTGPILLQSETAIGVDETAPELMARLAESGADLLGQTLAEPR